MGAGASALDADGKARVVFYAKRTLQRLNRDRMWTEAEKARIVSAKVDSAIRCGGHEQTVDVQVLKAQFARKNMRRVPESPGIPKLSSSAAAAAPASAAAAADGTATIDAGSGPSSPRAPKGRRVQSFVASSSGSAGSRAPLVISPRVTAVDEGGDDDEEEDGEGQGEATERTEATKKPATAVPTAALMAVTPTPPLSPRDPAQTRGTRIMVVEEAVPVDPFEGVDTWDSTKQQFLCAYCNMTFVNEKKMTFHLKYSDSHDKAVAKAKRKNVDEAEALVARRSLVYSGSKFFYKLSASIDLDVYFHAAVKPQCVEVLAFDSKRQADLPRLYLDYEGLLGMVKDDVEQYVKERKREVQFQLLEALTLAQAQAEAQVQAQAGGAGASEAPSSSVPAAASTEDFKEEEVRSQIQMTKLSSLILMRLKLNPGSSNSDASARMEFEPFSSDPCAFVLPAAPRRLVPVRLSRHKQVNLGDMSRKMDELRSRQAALSQSTSVAERMSNLVGAATGGFADTMRRRQEAKKSMSLARVRFQKAVRHVIAQIQVARTTRILIGMGLWSEEQG